MGLRTIIKEYGHKSKLMIRFAVAVKAITVSLSGYAYISEHNPKLAMIVFISGAIANEVINFLKSGENENSKTDNSSTDTK